jgi:predicted ATPase
MPHIEKVTVLEDFRTLKSGFSFSCIGINLLVGDQGSGKSTLLHLLKENSNKLQVELSEDCLKSGITTYFFDTENDNPRTKDPQLYASPSGKNRGIGYGNALMSRFQSHGETIKSLVLNPIKQAENCIVFLDEPESGLSLRNQYKLVDEIHRAIQRNVQFFVATHSLILIESCPIVVSLEHGEVMANTQFIKLNKI